MDINKAELRVLIIDDEETSLELLEALLLRMGFKNIKTAASCEDALLLTREFKPDLFFIDIMMPEMSGDEFRAALKENPATRDTPVIFISGIISRREEEDIHGRLASGDAIVAKPFTIDRIARAIAASLQKTA